MAILKCKMCGGNLEVADNITVCECEYCGTQQTLPKNHDDIAANLFNRANNLRIKSEFDKAQEIYEKIVNSNPDEAEAYWGIILCKYGIEYVEDPATFTKIPTCHRTQLESVRSDSDYLAALEHADAVQRTVYEKEALAIDKLQKDILDIVHNEKPFDVFICYKESDENGKRTPDSVIANDIYHQLTAEGFKVFYAAITLEDKLGQAYEPYIFAALNSAKVMLTLGTRPEYFNAVWVRNEWGRYLKLMKKDRSRLLIPCYKDMDAYDLPEEFSHLQAQDMGKIGFINDIIRGIKKVLVRETASPVQRVAAVQPPVQQTVLNIEPLLKRAFMFLEDGDWMTADEYCEKVLDMDPECARAYLGKLMAKWNFKSENELPHIPYTVNRSYPLLKDMDLFRKTYRFADDVLKAKLDEYSKENIYLKCINDYSTAETEEDYKKFIAELENMGDYPPAVAKKETCINHLEVYLKYEKRYVEALALIRSDDVEVIRKGMVILSEIQAHKDSKDQYARAQTRFIRINRLAEYQAQIDKIRSERRMLMNQCQSLGIFSGAEKKRISARLSELSTMEKRLENEYSDVT